MSQLGAPLPQIPSRVLVIGGGPSGLVTLRNLTERGQFSLVQLWERREEIGGVWYLGSKDPGRYPSPGYEGLIGNVLPEYLSFSGCPFPKCPSLTQPFPTLDETFAYLQDFARPFRKSGQIKLNTEIISVEELLPGHALGNWRVVSKDWTNEGEERSSYWDAVVISNGQYDNLVWPELDGLDDLRDNGIAIHSKLYNGPQDCEGKKVLVVGNANSSNDIASQAATKSMGPVFQSIRRPNFSGFPALPSDQIKIVAPISKFILKPSKKQFDAILTDGTTLTDLDVAYFGTGYRPFAPFVSVLDPTSTSSPPPLVPLCQDPIKPFRIPSLHRFTMYAHNSTLGFVGAAYVYTPFIISDITSTWLTLAWNNEIPYPSTAQGRLQYEADRLAIIAERRETMEDPTSFLTYSVMAQDEAPYATMLREDIVAARPELDALLPIWNDELVEARELMFKTKLEALAYARDHLHEQS